LIRRRQKIFHYLYAAERLIRVLSSVLHTVSYLCASTRPR
jgi:hypothetical protein